MNDHLFWKELFIRFTASAFRKLPSIHVFSYFPFGFEGRMWDLIVSVPDHCLSFYFFTLQTKQKRRKIHLYGKTDWTKFRSKMKEYQAKFLTNHKDKSVDQLWSDLTENLKKKITDECIPSKIIKGKPSLPWISHKIKCLIRNMNMFYKLYRKTGNTALKEKYLSLRHQIRRSNKDSHEAFLEE